jgi:hypothetical protein
MKYVNQKSAPLSVLRCMNFNAPNISELRIVLDDLEHPSLYQSTSWRGTKVSPVPGTHFPHLRSLAFAIIPRYYERYP